MDALQNAILDSDVFTIVDAEDRLDLFLLLLNRGGGGLRALLS
jgi:hypothetical protein